MFQMKQCDSCHGLYEPEAICPRRGLCPACSHPNRAEVHMRRLSAHAAKIVAARLYAELESMPVMGKRAARVKRFSVAIPSDVVLHAIQQG